MWGSGQSRAAENQLDLLFAVAHLDLLQYSLHYTGQGWADLKDDQEE